MLVDLFLVTCTNDIQSQTVSDNDGNIYQTVTIGSQVWMSENLKSLHYSDNVAITSAWKYNDNDSLAAIYGRLYSWKSALRGAASSNSIPSGVQGVCPEGWHLPGIAEWGILIDYYGGEMEAGAKLKEAGTVHWYPPNEGATNESGFTALPGGRCDNSIGSILGETGFWFTSTFESDNITLVIMGNEVPFAIQLGEYIEPGGDSEGFSVRCLKDPDPIKIEKIDKPTEFSIYPNPANDLIMIHLEENVKTELIIYEPRGRLILQKQLSQEENQIDISFLHEGIYILSLRNSRGIVNRQMIKIL